MKKLMNAVLGTSLLVATSSLVVSCRHAVYNPGLEGQRLLVITDTGSVADHSFNEQIYQSIMDYSNRPPNETGTDGGFDFSARGLSAENNWVRPLKSDYESYVNSYKLAKYKGTDIYVLSGFQQDMSLNQATQIAGPNKTIIFVDSAKRDAGPNVIPLAFSSQLAGFAAAYDSAVWATTVVGGRMQGQVYNKEFVSFGTYGGVSNKDATGSYMWGFLVGMAYFNARANQEGANERHLKLANFGTNGELNQLNGIQPTDNRFFTGSFESGGANRSGVNDLLGANEGRADVIFPIAGIQILDTLSTNRNAYMVGVDTNQALQFPEYQSRFVTSATKDLKVALFDTFDHAKANRLNHHINEDGSLGELNEDGPARGDFWDGTVPTPSPSWSHDVDLTMATVGTEIPKTLVDFGDKHKNMADLLVQFYQETGPATQDFLIWGGEHGIETIVGKLLALEKLPIEFDISENLFL